MLMKLTVGDELPLKLGERVPRVDELTLTLPGPDYGGVRWVVDAGTMISDLKHDAAPKPGGIPTKAAVKFEIEDAAMQRYKESLERSRARIDKDYEQHRAYPAGHFDHAEAKMWLYGNFDAPLTATEIELKRQNVEMKLRHAATKLHAMLVSQCPDCGGRGFHFENCSGL